MSRQSDLQRKDSLLSAFPLSTGQWDQDYKGITMTHSSKKKSVTIETADKWAHAKKLPLICLFKWEGN